MDFKKRDCSDFAAVRDCSGNRNAASGSGDWWRRQKGGRNSYERSRLSTIQERSRLSTIQVRLCNTHSPTGNMSQINAKEALGKKASSNKTTPVWNRKKMIAPRLLNRLSLQMQEKNYQNSSLDASASISKLPTKPKSTNASLHTTESISKLPTKPKSTSTTKSTCNSLVKSTTSASMPKPTNTPTTSPTPISTTPTASPTPTPTPTPTTPTTSPIARSNTLTASDPLDTSNNTATMPEVTPTTPTTSSPVDTSTTTRYDHVEESDAVQTVSTRPDGRIAVTVFNKILMPTDKCATVISDSFVERVDPDGYRWANVGENNKQFYWDEFKKHCFWEEQDDAKVRIAWKTKASLAYSQYVFNMRNPQRNKTKKKPSHVSEQVWASWWEKWNLEDFKMISNQNKVNRRNGVPDAPACPTHTSGSASHVKIASKLKRTLGCEPAHSEFFLYRHTTNHDGETFINDKDREIHASYLEKREQLQATGDDDSIFYEVLGGHDRKRRLYGFGSYGKLIPSKEGSNDTYYTPETNANKELAEKNAELAQMKELVTAQKEQNDQLKELVKMQADQLKTQNEQSTSKIDNLERQLQSFFESFKQKTTE